MKRFVVTTIALALFAAACGTVDPEHAQDEPIDVDDYEVIEFKVPNEMTMWYRGVNLYPWRDTSFTSIPLLTSKHRNHAMVFEDQYGTWGWTPTSCCARYEWTRGSVTLPDSFELPPDEEYFQDARLLHIIETSSSPIDWRFCVVSGKTLWSRFYEFRVRRSLIDSIRTATDTT